MRRALLIVLLATSSLCQSPQAQPSAGQAGKSNPKQKETQTPPPEPPKSPVVAAALGQSTTRPNANQAQCQSEIPWRHYFCEAFAPPTLASWVLSFFAAIAAGISLWTLSAIAQQARIARIGLEATRRAANAARLSAVAAQESNTLTIESNAITRDATDLTRQSLVLSHRPKIIVRDVSVEGGLNGFRAGSTADGRFTLTNIGGTKAVIQEIFASANMIDILPMQKPYEKVPAGIAPRSLGLGSRCIGTSKGLIVPWRRVNGWRLTTLRRRAPSTLWDSSSTLTTSNRLPREKQRFVESSTGVPYALRL